MGRGEINYYGTMIAKISVDGGSSDGKTWNSNVVVNINGNFIMTEKPISFSGNPKVVFHKGKDAGNYIPVYEKTYKLAASAICNLSKAKNPQFIVGFFMKVK